MLLHVIQSKLKGENHRTIPKGTGYEIRLHKSDPPLEQALAFLDACVCVTCWVFLPFQDEQREIKFRKEIERAIKRAYKRYWV